MIEALKEIAATLMSMVRAKTDTKITFATERSSYDVSVNVRTDLPSDLPFRATLIADIAMDGIISLIYKQMISDCKRANDEGFDPEDFVNDYVDNLIGVHLKERLLAIFNGDAEVLFSEERKEQKDNG